MIEIFEKPFILLSTLQKKFYKYNVFVFINLSKTAITN